MARVIVPENRGQFFKPMPQMTERKLTEQCFSEKTTVAIMNKLVYHFFSQYTPNRESAGIHQKPFRICRYDFHPTIEIIRNFHSHHYHLRIQNTSKPLNCVLGGSESVPYAATQPTQ